MTVDKIVLTIYYEKDWEYLDIQNINICSPYMKELTQFLTRVQKSYLSTYDNKDILNVKFSIYFDYYFFQNYYHRIKFVFFLGAKKWHNVHLSYLSDIHCY